MKHDSPQWDFAVDGVDGGGDGDGHGFTKAVEPSTGGVLHGVVCDPRGHTD